MTLDLSLEQTIIIIFVLCLLIFLSPLINSLSQNATAQSLQTKCALSIHAKLAGEGATYGLTSPFDINCDRRIIQLEKKQAEIFNHASFERVSRTTPYTYDVARERGDEVVRSARSLRTDSDNLTKDFLDAVAYEATECWQTFLSGRADILSSETVIASAKSCVVCAEFTINDEDFSSAPVDVAAHLRQRPHYLSDEPRGSFADVLYTDQEPSNSRECSQESWKIEPFELRSGETYAVVFYRDGSWAGGQCQAITVAPVSEVAEKCVAVLN